MQQLQFVNYYSTKQALTAHGKPPCTTYREEIQSVVKTVSMEFGLEAGEIFNKSRAAEFQRIKAARIEVVIRCFSMGCSMAAIGRELGVHHTTILYTVRKAQRAAVERERVPRRQIAPTIAEVHRKKSEALTQKNTDRYNRER